MVRYVLRLEADDFSHIMGGSAEGGCDSGGLNEKSLGAILDGRDGNADPCCNAIDGVCDGVAAAVVAHGSPLDGVLLVFEPFQSNRLLE